MQRLISGSERPENDSYNGLELAPPLDGGLRSDLFKLSLNGGDQQWFIPDDEARVLAGPPSGALVDLARNEAGVALVATRWNPAETGISEAAVFTAGFSPAKLGVTKRTKIGAGYNPSLTTTVEATKNGLATMLKTNITPVPFTEDPSLGLFSWPKRSLIGNELNRGDRADLKNLIQGVGSESAIQVSATSRQALCSLAVVLMGNVDYRESQRLAMSMYLMGTPIGEGEALDINRRLFLIKESGMEATVEQKALGGIHEVLGKICSVALEQ